MGRCPVRLHQLPAIGPGTSDTAARPGRSVAAGNILDVGQASSLGAWRVLHGHLPGKPDARPSARSASGCTIPHHDSTPDQPAGRTPCASPTAGKFTEAIAGSAAKSQRGGHFGLCRRPIRSGPLHGVRDRHHAPITSICAAIPFNRWPLPEIQNGYVRVPDRCRGYGVQPDVDAAIWPQALGTARRWPVRPRAGASCTEAAPPRRRWLACRARSTSPRPDGRWHNATTPFELQFA